MIFVHLLIYRMPAAAPPAENGAAVPKTELQELQMKQQQVVDEVWQKRKKKRILHLQSKAFPVKLGYCEISYWNPIFSLCILCAFSCTVVTCRPSSIVPGQYPPYAGTMWGGKINLLLLFVNHYLVLSHYHVRYGSETSGNSFRNAMIMMMMMMEDE